MTVDAILLFGQALVGAGLLACCAWSSYLLAAKALPAAPVSVRWSAAAIVGLWSLVALWLLLASVALFRSWAAVVIWVALGVAAHRRLDGAAGWSRLRQDLRALAGAVGSLSIVFKVLLGAVFAIAIARTCRGLVAPPLGWDALTYHLLKAGRWVQSGTFVSEAAPDAWGYYEYFLPFGDVVWAWAMLPVGGDALLAPAGLLVWLSVVLGAYAVARSLGIRQGAAVVGAAVVASVPTVINFVTAAYVENLTASVFLLGAVFVIRALQGLDRPSFVLAAAALGIGAGIKIVALPYLLVGFGLLAVEIVRTASLRSRLVPLVAACAVAAAIALPPYVRAWVETGSPIYPVAVSVGGRVVAAGNEEMALVHSGKIFLKGRTRSFADTARMVVIPDTVLVLAGYEFLGLGPATPLVLLLGLVGAVVLLMRRRFALPLVYLLASAAATVLSILPESNEALRTVWAFVLGRHLIVPFAVLALLSMVRDDRATRIVMALVLVVHLVLAIPRSWGEPDTVALTLGAAWMVWILGFGFIAFRAWARSELSRVTALLVAVFLALPYVVILDIRLKTRYSHYLHAARSQIYDIHYLDPAFLSSWPLWAALDETEGATVAAAAGWDGIGHNWYRYPLLGSRLQNRVIYVPVTRDGSLVDYRARQALESKADFDAWIQRLEVLGVDYFAALPPRSIEAEWIDRHPERFSPVARGEDGRAMLYRFERAGATPR
jgi:hypothetical protein